MGRQWWRGREEARDEMKPTACLKSATKTGRRASSFLLRFLLPGSCSDLWEAYTALKTHEVITFPLDVPLSEMKDWSHGSSACIVYNFLPLGSHFVWPNQVQSSSCLTVSPYSLVCSEFGGGDVKSFAAESVDPGCRCAVCNAFLYSSEQGFHRRQRRSWGWKDIVLCLWRLKGRTVWVRAQSRVFRT